MKCPLEIIGEFNEWSNTCQECRHYQECMNKCYDLDKQDPKDPNKEYHTYQCPECNYTIEIAEEDDSIDAGHKCPHCRRKLIIKDITRAVGDNFPTYGTIHFRMSLNREHKEMVKKLFKEGFGKITPDDVIDVMIDIELYNKECRKQKIKERYNRKKEKNDSI
jgi:DNA-directed RNA polymerase subunit RPC12/RpoP